MKKKQVISQLKELVRKECANCINDNCLLGSAEIFCPQIGRLNTFVPKSKQRLIVCKYFNEAVLPLASPSLLARIAQRLQTEQGETVLIKRCTLCGILFVANGNRAVYCESCALHVRRKKWAASSSEYRIRKKEEHKGEHHDLDSKKVQQTGSF